MDVLRYLHELQIRKEMIERAIAELSQSQVGSAPRGSRAGKRRGRKSMGLEERREVSDRMQRYGRTAADRLTKVTSPPQVPWILYPEFRNRAALGQR